ncbi:MAG: extracellular solute-binding protein [Clostridia bacterium]|nr:extracellular solute-binding protein [Clostridia bacterium]
MKRFLSLVLALLMAASMLVLTACPTEVTPGWQIGETTFDTETPVTIKFYSTMGKNLIETIDPFLAQFMELYPNITVKHTQPGGYDEVRDQIKTELTVGEQPNIAYCYPDHVAMYNRSGKVITLDQFIDHEIYGLTDAEKADFIEGFYNEGRQFGDEFMYTLPFSKSTEVLYYNKDVFAKHNLTVPTTWEEMEEVCRTLKELYPESTPLGYDSEANWFITMCEQYNSGYTSVDEKGNPSYDFDNATNREFVKMFAEWHYDGLVTTKELNGAAYTSGLFVEQKSFMSIGSSAGATHQRPEAVDGAYPFDVGIAPIPQVDATNNPKVISQGPSLCLLDTGDAQENIAAWLLMKFLTTNVQLQAAFADASGYVPVLESVTEVPAFAAKLEKADGGNNIAYLSMKVCLEQADYYYTSPAFNGSSTARDQVGYLMQAAMSGYKDAIAAGKVDQLIDKAFKDAINECENQL